MPNLFLNNQHFYFKIFPSVNLLVGDFEDDLPIMS